MTDKLKNKIVVFIFLAFIIGFMFVNIFTPSIEISKSERRKLTQFPELTWESIKSTKFMSNFEKYALDQFTFREGFRKVKAQVLFNIFMQKDNNNIYFVGNQVSKYQNTLNEASVNDVAKKFNKLYEQYLSKMNVYYSVIPDKNYYIAGQNGYPSIDYNKFVNILNNNVNNMTYIDLFDSLSEEDYYSTDTHWKQQNLDKVLDKLSVSMNIPIKSTSEYEKNILNQFYGVYYGQSALPIEADDLIYLTNEDIDNAKVTILDENTFEMVGSTVYDANKFADNDPYDVFLSGPKPLIVIENEKSLTDRELTIFRDSFGSSLSPLLINSYRKITIVDLRYMASPLLKQFVELKEGQDALIINCVDVLNNSSTIKVF